MWTTPAAPQGGDLINASFPGHLRVIVGEVWQCLLSPVEWSWSWRWLSEEGGRIEDFGVGGDGVCGGVGVVGWRH